jgi:hypothetical protein
MSVFSATLERIRWGERDDFNPLWGRNMWEAVRRRVHSDTAIDWGTQVVNGLVYFSVPVI